MKGREVYLGGVFQLLKIKVLQSADSIMALGFSLSCCKDH